MTFVGLIVEMYIKFLKYYLANEQSINISPSPLMPSSPSFIFLYSLSKTI